MNLIEFTVDGRDDGEEEEDDDYCWLHFVNECREKCRLLVAFVVFFSLSRKTFKLPF